MNAMNDEIRLRGQDTADGMREWIRSEIRRGPESRHGLGRFLFGVSSATMGTMVALEKLSDCAKLDWWLGVSLAALLVSAVIALVLAIPKRNSFPVEKALVVLHSEYLERIARFSRWWFVTWLSGVAVGVFAAIGR